MTHQPELIPAETSPEQAARDAEREKYLALPGAAGRYGKSARKSLILH